MTNKGRRRALRSAVLNAYGHQCVCCGEQREEFLAVDHTYGGGNQHRKQLRREGHDIYTWLSKYGCPQDGRFRLLCHNCNASLACYGYCPHGTFAESLTSDPLIESDDL